MKKFSALAISFLLSSITHGAQFILVECYIYPNGYGYFSEPVTGQTTRVNSCGEALAKVPPGYFLLSAVGAAGDSSV